MKENNWNFAFSEPFQETLKELNKIQASAAALSMSQALKAAMPNYRLDGVYAALKEFTDSQKVWREMVLPSTSFVETVIAACPTLKLEIPNIAQSVLAQIDTSALAALRESVSFAELTKYDWSWLAEAYAEDTEDNVEDVTSDPAKTAVTEEVRAEMAEDINQILADPDTMHLASQSKYLQWKARNPGFAAFFLDILLPILLLLADWGFSCWQARATKDAHVYEEPVATSNVVYNLTVENNVTVIGDEPYYYEVEFVNPETGEQMIGYVYKANLAAEEPEETETQEEMVPEEEMEATEESAATTEATEPLTEVSE